MDTTLEVLQVALEFERKGMEYYRQAAERVRDGIVQSVLLSLADDEVAHQSIISRYYQAIENGRELPADSERDIPASPSASARIESITRGTLASISADSTYEEVYKTASELEKRSYEYYSAQHSDNPRVDAFYKYLAGVERIHLEMLQLMVELPVVKR